MKTANRAVRLLAVVAALLLATIVALPATAQTLDETIAAYERGDYPSAFQGFRFYAEQGGLNAAGARLALGAMYGRGQGVSRDYAEAAKWLRQAAEQGYAEVQHLVGAAYAKGEIVTRDDVEAARWYRRAAEQGYASAQNDLGLMYEQGKGVVQDFVQAHKWFNLAASRFPASEQDRREKTVRNRDRVGSRMTPADLALAQRSAREWRPRREFDFSTLPKESASRQPGQERPPPSSDTGGPYPDENASRIAGLQRALGRLGYNPGPADGVLGARTRAAIRAFQADAGLPVTGRLSERLDSAVLAALTAPAGTPNSTRPPLKQESTGSGFWVSARGHILTNAHVVRGCTEVHVPSVGAVRVVAREDSTDLALLRNPAEKAETIARFRQGRGIRPGASVVVIGYPLRGLLASEANVSTGAVSALAGPRDDRRFMQITAPVQPGNSGGPVLDASGNVVGVVVSKLNAIRVARATGDIPQNVNFAIGAGAARAFLDAEGVLYETAPSAKESEPVEVAAAARKFTVLVECWK